MGVGHRKTLAIGNDDVPDHTRTGDPQRVHRGGGGGCRRRADGADENGEFPTARAGNRDWTGCEGMRRPWRPVLVIEAVVAPTGGTFPISTRPILLY